MKNVNEATMRRNSEVALVVKEGGASSSEVALSADDRARLVRLVEEAAARMQEVGMILARTAKLDPAAAQTVLGGPEAMRAYATGKGVRMDFSGQGPFICGVCDSHCCVFYAC